MREVDRLKFAALATKRVNKAVSMIRLIGNLSNKSNYSYTEEDVRKIFSHLQKEIREAKRRFEEGSEGEKGTFRIS